MIGYIEGSLFRRKDDRVMVLANGVGYEVLLPQVVAESLAGTGPGDFLRLFIYWHQTERSPKPLLIGFNSEEEREFFEVFLSVEDIGPVKAVAALCIPITEIALAVENRDSRALLRLKGVGKRTADKIVATLNGKLGRFVDTHAGPTPGIEPLEETRGAVEQVTDVLTRQLGHSPNEAKDMITKALLRRPDITTPEELFDEVYRGAL
ncbi:MAG: Holliday junction DNA helicase RuvA [Deltaproteobacteria bacterium]|nr:Holliday junction DNA helicase RuvA [Deltaproteobacteria bacterium]